MLYLSDIRFFSHHSRSYLFGEFWRLLDLGSTSMSLALAPAGVEEFPPGRGN
jgi:hypothetical protein